MLHQVEGLYLPLTVASNHCTQTLLISFIPKFDTTSNMTALLSFTRTRAVPGWNIALSISAHEEEQEHNVETFHY